MGKKEGKVDENVRISRSRARTAVAPCGLYGNGLEFRKPQPKKNFPAARGRGGGSAVFELVFINILLFIFFGYTFFTHVLEAAVPASVARNPYALPAGRLAKGDYHSA